MKLTELLGPYRDLLNDQDREISSLCTDSRLASTDCLFFAIKGLHTDSHLLVKEVIEKGAVAIVTENPLPDDVSDFAKKSGACILASRHTRSVLSHAASAWYGHPAQKLRIFGITGTDGKSSSVFFLWQLLVHAGIKAGFFSTVSISYGAEVLPNSLRQSTPEPLELHKILFDMLGQGVTHVVMESTSHGLSSLTARLKDVEFEGAGFTNLSHEHLEFHGTYEKYRDDKTNLFRRARNFCVLNSNDKEAPSFLEAARAPVETYRLGRQALVKGLPAPELCAVDILENGDSLDFTLVDESENQFPAHLPFPGIFNAENVMLAVLMARKITGLGLSVLVPWLEALKGVKGRMIPVRLGQDFSVIVDYAHTPGSFERLFPLFRASCKGRLIAVFGSAGERDTTKRPMQGAIAARYSDVLVLCNEDPRLEDPMTIIKDIFEGAKTTNPDIEWYGIPDRYSAILKAFSLARKSDLVLLLGKGHEQSIVFKDGKIPWDDEEMAKKALKELLV